RRVGLLWGRLHAGRRSGGHTPLGRLAPALAGVNPAPHTGGSAAGGAVVGPASCRPTERRTHAPGPAGAGLGRGKPGPTQEARRRVGLLWGRLHAGRRSRGHMPRGRLAPALAGVNPGPTQESAPPPRVSRLFPLIRPPR